MKLKVDLYLYLKRNNLTAREFSKFVGCRPELLGKILNGKRLASPMIAAAIEKLTNGEVTAKLLREEE